MKGSKLLLSILAFLIQVTTAQAQNWQLDLAEAQKIALESNKSIVLVFSGSDWCAPCIKLEREIWQTADFITYAETHYVMVRADFPKHKNNQLSVEQQKINNLLAEKYNPEGYFPLVLVLDKNATILGKTGYKKLTPLAYIDHLNSFIQ